MAVSSGLRSVRKSLSELLKYVKNPAKTDLSQLPDETRETLLESSDGSAPERRLFVRGLFCDPDTALEEFRMVKHRFLKEDGVQAYHGYISFHSREVTPETALEIGTEYAQTLWGERFQVVLAVHMNTDNIHIHFVINSVSFRDGLRLNEGTSWFRTHHLVDKLCEQHGLSVIRDPDRRRQPRRTAFVNRSGKPTWDNFARISIDHAIVQSMDFRDFRNRLAQMGIRFELSDKGDFYRIRPDGYPKSIRSYRLGPEYTYTRIKERIEETPCPPQPFGREGNRYRIPTREDALAKLDGLPKIYRTFCWITGIDPPFRYFQDPARIPSSLRSDLTELESIGRESRFLARNGLTTPDRVEQYRTDTRSDLRDLERKRERIYNFLRRKATDADEPVCRAEIAAINRDLKFLRREEKLCTRILERAPLLEQKLEQLHEPPAPVRPEPER